VCLERLEKLDHLLFVYTALVQPEQVVRAAEAGDYRHMIPVEVKLNDRRLPPGCPGTHPSGTLADVSFVDEDNQPVFALGFF
jgi:hypothetical protein